MTKQETPLINVDTLREQIIKDNVRIIDVRRKDDYNQDHIRNSVNLPLANLLADPSPENIVRIAEELGIGDETHVVVYDDTFGALSSRVVWALQYIGHTNVKLLDVTFSQWKELGLEVTTEEPEIKPVKHSLNLRPEIMATAEYLEKAKEKKSG